MDQTLIDKLETAVDVRGLVNPFNPNRHDNQFTIGARSRVTVVAAFRGVKGYGQVGRRRARVQRARVVIHACDAIQRDDDRATWLRRQIKIFIPVLFTVVAGVYAAVNYVVSHWKA